MKIKLIGRLFYETSKQTKKADQLRDLVIDSREEIAWYGELQRKWQL